MNLNCWNFNRIVTDQTKPIRFLNPDRLIDLSGCTVGSLRGKAQEPYIE